MHHDTISTDIVQENRRKDLSYTSFFERYYYAEVSASSDRIIHFAFPHYSSMIFQTRSNGSRPGHNQHT